jgi:ATP-binding protein involved in chromosome partitioning
MFGLRGPPSVNPETKELIPLVNYGVRVMSMGFLAKEDAPTIWRGPMVMGALEQLLRQVCWAPLDILVVDLPPGTGDAQLTLCQRVSLSGAIIVSTPQDIALIDARRGINMFRQVDVPLLGLIENMSKYVCSKCGHTEYVFGSHGAFETAREFGIPFLGEVPLEPEVRHSSDMGQPVILSAPDSPAAKALMEIAKQVLYALQAVNSSKPPSIEIQ